MLLLSLWLKNIWATLRKFFLSYTTFFCVPTFTKKTVAVTYDTIQRLIEIWSEFKILVYTVNTTSAFDKILKSRFYMYYTYNRVYCLRDFKFRSHFYVADFLYVCVTVSMSFWWKYHHHATFFVGWLLQIRSFTVL